MAAIDDSGCVDLSGALEALAEAPPRPPPAPAPAVTTGELVKLLADMTRERDRWRRACQDKSTECEELRRQHNLLVISYQEMVYRAQDQRTCLSEQCRAARERAAEELRRSATALETQRSAIYAECTPECFRKRQQKYRSFEP